MLKGKIIKFDSQPIRLDTFLAGKLNHFSRNQLKELIKSGKALVEGKKVKPSYILDKPCKVKIILPKEPKNSKEFEKNIIYEDKHIIVFSKPYGLLVHPLSPAWERFPEAVYLGRKNLAALIISSKKVPIKKVERAGLLHRLDSDTSGVMVIAKSCDAQKNLLSQFRERKVCKVYKAICGGNIPASEGVIDIPVGRLTGGKIKAGPFGRYAVTRYKVLKQTKEYAFLKLIPLTGRTNQLRAHLAWLGCPIIGDKSYNGKPYKRLMLHAESLTFTHPQTGKKITFKINLPKEFATCWKDFKKSF